VSGSERAGVLLVGGGVASVRCARALRRHGFTDSIVLIGAERVLPYNRPPLSKELLRDDLPDDLVLAEPASWYERRGIDLILGARVVGLDPESRTVTLDDGRTIGYERCLLATGAEPRILPVPGAEHALVLRTLDHARRLRSRAVAVGRGAPVTVVGGGFIGIEVASGLAEAGLRPTIVEMAADLWGGTLGTELASWARGRLGEASIEARFAAEVNALTDAFASIGEERLEHALCVAGIGVRPRTEIGETAGLTIDDGIVTDAEGRTSAPGIWAAGDVARLDGRRVEHWHAAREGGERAALSMLGLPVPPLRAPWVFSEVGGASVDVVGNAREWDEERWLGGSVLAFLRDERVLQVAVIDAAISIEDSRAMVERNAPIADLEGIAGA
jgi:NADPH-dependent 2,4-dienoyl-CoA reductase/sulfur reductase-like enzyme